MTYDEYIRNPMGTGNFVVSARDMYRQMYTEKWNRIKLRENGVIVYRMYTDDIDYYIHIKIPSEVVPKFYYDVIIRFYPPKGKGHIQSERTLNNYEVQFYSNDPSFVFTFAHAFNKNKLFIKDLESKMSKLSLTTKADSRNPKDQVGYVKSLYFAYIEMRNLGLFQKRRWDGVSKPYNKSIWTNTVTHADDKVKHRQEKGLALQRKERREKLKQQNIEKNRSFHTSGVPNFNKNFTPDFNKAAKTIDFGVNNIKKATGLNKRKKGKK